MDEPKPARDRESVESGESSPSKVVCRQESERGHEDKDGKPPTPELTKILVAVYHDKDDCHGIPALGPHPDAKGFEKNANYHYPDKNKKCECVNTEVDLKDVFDNNFIEKMEDLVHEHKQRFHKHESAALMRDVFMLGGEIPEMHLTCSEDWAEVFRTMDGRTDPTFLFIEYILAP
ncbi:hypothetical protein SUNI508_04663 [Seiridium unicorne]|uniref:Uncharacterized protein n=1 Tax=Seiridium unicorne TaxID=138068 RepID=A0ABR2V8Z4_9PEZI